MKLTSAEALPILISKPFWNCLIKYAVRIDVTSAWALCVPASSEDASATFVEHAKKTGWYKDCDAFYFGNGVDQFPDKYKGRFDAVTASGVFLPNHMPPQALEDCHACLKTGGHFVTAIRTYLWVQGEKHGYRDKLDEMFNKGQLKLIGTKEFSRGHKDGIEMFSEQASIMICMQRVDWK